MSKKTFRTPSIEEVLDKTTQSGGRWTFQENLTLRNLKLAGHTYAEIAEVMTKSIGRREYSENLCYKKWQQTDWKAFNEKLTAAENDSEDPVLIEKERIIENTLARQQRYAVNEQAMTQIMVEAVKSAIWKLPKPKPSNISYKPKKSSKYRPEHAGLVLSDIHIGADYSLQETGGLSEYNFDICKKRIEVLKQSVLEIVERHRKMYAIPELHIFCLGDIVAGMNEAGAWSQSYIKQDIVEQLFNGVAILRDVVATFSQAFEKIHFYGVYGNHGRVGRKGTHKTFSNWDHIAYQFVQGTMAEYENVEWDIPIAWYIQKRIQNHNFYITHGDGIKGSMGIPYYGVERAERSVVGLMDEKPQYFLLGHFHSAAEIQTNSSRIIMNGSFMGGDMYSLRDLGRADKPEQKLFGIHENRGVTWSYNIHLDNGG